jgi:hypothetical protein
MRLESLAQTRYSSGLGEQKDDGETESAFHSLPRGVGSPVALSIDALVCDTVMLTTITREPSLAASPASRALVATTISSRWCRHGTPLSAWLAMVLV